MPLLSVIIITKNEENHISECLNSVAWCDEIIVVDSGSTDNTVTLCRSFTDKVFVTKDWLGFGVQKNRALVKATGKWILSIDADERITPALQQEIKSVIADSTDCAFRIPRQSRYCGRWIKHSGWSPDYVLRLFRSGCASFTDDLVHERVQVLSGEIGTLSTPLLHYSFNSLEEVLEKVNTYSSASAEMQHAKGKKSSLTKAIFHGLWAFIRTYLLQAGFLEGREGFMLAVSNAEGTYYRYLKLMYLQENIKNKP
ncbi:glycosyltransferase family 2 protein [Candidatus Parabeggiatoa sp. HSG14]|uniref:glycosyltransferase family 2 protein n=1 Tax=Candidatus Parabeggiatoa sp. HSG14 TaxID=3055593 RepID=UPI0025A9166A|nr:glycosyltransferase family 2 protein [Thiotrichales bacterium HSG14]